MTPAYTKFSDNLQTLNWERAFVEYIYSID